ncbi:MAG: hypothetical protein JNL67_05460 [Planctomycetaceae bacterium]|nr:hypothetical protein [Planctomycetaceae bacterium]
MTVSKSAPDSARRFSYIVLGSIAYACLLGIALDLVTANVAVAYFSVHHPQIVETDNPWILAFVWGVAASWWFGLIGGVVIAFANQLRTRPLRPQRILRWVRRSCVVLWIVMLLILVATWSFAYYMVPMEKRPENFEDNARLIAVAMAHQFEYLLGGIAMMVIGFLTWFARSDEQDAQLLKE